MALITTIESDDEVEIFSDSETDEENITSPSPVLEKQSSKAKAKAQTRNSDETASRRALLKKSREFREIHQSKSKIGKKDEKKKTKEILAKVLSSSFTFEDENEDFDGDAVVQQSWDFESAIKDIKEREDPSQALTTTLDEKIQVVIEKRKQKATSKAETSDASSSQASEEESEEEESMEGVEEESKGKYDESSTDDSSDSESSLDGSDDEDHERTDTSKDMVARITKKDLKLAEEARKRKEDTAISFSQLNLSRPLMKALQVLGFERPTPIQARAIPFSLRGRDICGSAVTGSGKTAAYLLPTLERLLFRPRSVAVIRVLILTPTRELAQQVLSMCQKLAQFTDIESMCVVGGLNLQAQATQLRGRPDIVVATPGRLIDHVRNTQSVDLDDVEILILDEADRLLEMGFTDEVMEVVKFCPKSKQTLLYSATMTTSVNQLAELSLNRPVRVAADPLYDMANRLVQEFVRIRESREFDREAMLLALCSRTFKSETIIFFRRKLRAHRMGIIFGLSGLKAAELHGNLTQRQRLESLQRFKDGKANFLLCTDVASRGLDISGVKTVLNFEMPRDLTTYVHRVGRTARAGRGGHAVTLTGERHRKLMKEVLKRSKLNVKSRQIPDNIIDSFKSKIKGLEPEIKEVIDQEKLEKQVRKAEMEVTKATNMIEHRDEIMSKPARTWFQSEKDKLALRLAQRKEAAKLDRNGDGDIIQDDGGSDNEGLNSKERRKARRKKEHDAVKEKESKRPHRMNRKKRRRMELRKFEEQERTRIKEEAKEGNTTKESVPMEVRQKAVAKKSKKGVQTKNAEDLHATIKDRSAKKSKKVTSKRLPGFDYDIADRSESFIDKRGKAAANQSTEFKQRDILKTGGLRKGGKLGRNKFKSRQKYNRRKKK